MNGSEKALSYCQKDILKAFKRFIVQAPDTDSIQLFSLSLTESKLERP